eukprot:TRINITY_DN5419_c0_g6_i1.p1 TRINITY_DN5419_c0_g6~~TRINITY_DN5419_c0_g6_i1.p1  ORF type:complete len:437 (+),score=57.42 TRINITY_DN5419_c0_g6_i1:95-1405(+)
MSSDGRFQAGSWVVAHGLSGAPELNGLAGRCCPGGATRGSTRDRVGVDFGAPYGVKALRISNLRAAEEALRVPDAACDLSGSYILVRGQRRGFVTTCDLAMLGSTYSVEYSDGEEEDVKTSDVRILPESQAVISGSVAKPCTEKDSGDIRFNIECDVHLGWCAMQGWRPYQEDTRCAVRTLDGHPSVALAAVFDGHGGSRVSEYLARSIAGALSERLPVNTSSCGDVSVVEGHELRVQVRQSLCDTLLYLDRNVPEGARTQGATANIVLIVPRCIVVANAGDSRSVLYGVNDAGELGIKHSSVDHHPNVESERKRIESTGHRVEKNRINGILAVSRSIGDHEFKQVDGFPLEEQACTAFPDVYFQELSSAVNILVLAGDGIWGCLGSLQVGALALELFNQGRSPAELASALVDRCLSPSGKGAGTDNMTVHVIVWR